MLNSSFYLNFALLQCFRLLQHKNDIDVSNKKDFITLLKFTFGKCFTLRYKTLISTLLCLTFNEHYCKFFYFTFMWIYYLLRRLTSLFSIKICFFFDH